MSKRAKPADLHGLAQEIAAQEEVLRKGGTGQERQKKLGRLTARERLDLLVDMETLFLELNLWAAHEMYEEEVPAAGVICGVGLVEGRWCMIVANDATVKAGAFFPATCKKVLRAQRIAGRCNLPLIYMVDSSGVYLPMQDEVFPDEDDFGRIFRNNAVLSAMGVPQIAAIMGNCVAGGAYLPVLCDKILMTKNSALYLAGPALVKAAIGQETSAEELGGAAMHARQSGTIDFMEEDDPACIVRLRNLIGLLPDPPKAKAGECPQRKPRQYTSFCLSMDATNTMRELIACIVDAGSVEEYKAEYGKTLVCAYAAIDGTKIGIVANQHLRTRTASGEVQLGGVIYADSADKAARFVMDCSQNGLPILFLQDVTGFMVGRDAEQGGIIRSGAKMVNAVSNASVPKITLVVGGSFGAGNYALCGKAFDPCFIFALPGARYAVMGAQQAAQTMAMIEKQSVSPKTLEKYQSQMDIRFGAARGWVDAIIMPEKVREVLSFALKCAIRSGPSGGFRGGVMQV